MPIKTDETGKRWVEMELLVPGTPDQVWHAMATGPGTSGWFTKAEIESRLGGALLFDFGGGATSRGEVTAWEPPHRFGYVEREWEKGAPPCATEITITARSGDRCVIRMVHSLFTSSDDWDDQLEGFEGGWPGFFKVLRVYLKHFAGQAASAFVAVTTVNADAISTWKRLCDGLDLAGANAGERRTSSSGPERWSGVVEHVHQDAEQRYLILRLDEPSPGIALVGIYDKGGSSGAARATNVSVCRYLYGEAAIARTAETESRWRAWLGESFGSAKSEGA